MSHHVYYGADSDTYYLADPYERYFLGFSDIADDEFRFDIQTIIEKYGDDPNVIFDHMPKEYAISPSILRIFYTIPHHRGKGLQKRVFGEVIELAEKHNEVFASFADPFKLKTGGGWRETTATEAMIKLMQNHYDDADDWQLALVKQRERFLSYGMRNIRFTDAQLTGPWQSFMYIPTNADEGIKELADELELFYVVNYDKIK